MVPIEDLVGPEEWDHSVDRGNGIPRPRRAPRPAARAGGTISTWTSYLDLFRVFFFFEVDDSAVSAPISTKYLRSCF